MNLHELPEQFSELIQATAENIGLPQIYVEKDYWLTKALKHLSESKHVQDVVFKGGTSLSKAFRLIDRFSEDIDLAVFSKDKGDAQRKKMLKDVEQTVNYGLTYLANDARESKGSNYRKTVYQYPREINGEEFGQASPELLIEVNAFTHPEPFELRTIRPLISDALQNLGREDLISEYSLQEFSINVLSVRRTLVEKMLGVIKDSYDENPVARLSDRIRHLYDICMILRHDEYKNFIQSEEFMPLCEICIQDERAGFFKYSDCFEKPLKSAPLFSEFKTWRPSVEITYNGLFADLVYGDRPTMDEIAQAINLLRDGLE